jgi:CubicO group peptidase (beta-lactamase class C family)
MDRFHIPGLSACIVKDGAIVRHNAYGRADTEGHVPMTETTAVNLASVSKSYTGTAVMRLREHGLLDIDADINTYLPFQVRHSRFPGATITPRMLMTYTSGIIDNWTALSATLRHGDPVVPLGIFLERYLVPGGAHYDSALNFGTHAPGTYYEYSNVGAALDSFHGYTRDSLLGPLGMNRSAWYFRDFDTTTIAVPYWWTGSAYSRFGHESMTTIPAGFLKSTALDMGRFLIAFLQWGRYDTVWILDSASVALMTTVQGVPNVGLHWIRGTTGGRQCWYHAGQWNGTATLHSFCRNENTGVVVLTNVDSDSIMHCIFSHITPALYDYAPYTGAKETPSQEVRATSLRPTIMRGVLEIGSPPTVCGSRPEVGLFDANGRRVAKLHAGPNDVRRLAPGVYFVWSHATIKPVRVLLLK